MQIVFGEEAANQLKTKYTVLKLEDVDTGSGILHPYCVIPVEQIAMQMATLEQDIALHDKFVDAIGKNDAKLCESLAPHLLGKFGGELDTFYQIVVDRCQTTGQATLVLPAVPEDQKTP